MLADPPILHNQHTVDAGDRRQAVGDHDCGSPAQKPGDSPLDQCFGRRVEAGRGFVQNNQPWIAQEGAPEG